MDKNRLTVLLASFVTLILGPGAGHLVIKQWRRAVFFISLALGLLMILGITFVSDAGRETLTAVTNFSDINRFKEIYYKFQDSNPKMMLFFDVFFSALWAYSIVDIFLISKNKQSAQEEEKK